MEEKKKLYVERDGFWTEAAMLLMALAMVFRLIGSIGRWEDMHYMTTQVALPIVSGLLYLLCLLLFGKRAFWTTVIPVVAGLVFFIFRIMGLENGLPDDLTPYAETFRATREGSLTIYLSPGGKRDSARIHIYTDSGLTADLEL